MHKLSTVLLPWSMSPRGDSKVYFYFLQAAAFAGSNREKVTGVDALGRWGGFGLVLSLDDLTDMDEM